MVEDLVMDNGNVLEDGGGYEPMTEESNREERTYIYMVVPEIQNVVGTGCL